MSTSIIAAQSEKKIVVVYQCKHHRACALSVYFLDATKIRVLYNESIVWWLRRQCAASDNTDAQSCNTQPYCLLNHQIIIGASLSEPHTSLVPGAEEERLVHTDVLPVNYKWRCSHLWHLHYLGACSLMKFIPTVAQLVKIASVSSVAIATI